METKEKELTAEAFYKKSISLLKKSGIPFMIGGTFAVKAYTRIDRQTKDVDFFCKASDYPKILNYFTKLGYKTSIEDERWIAKVHEGKFFFDIIFNSANAIMPVRELWFTNSQKAPIYDMDVSILGPTELIWSKAFVADRHKYDGCDIAHIILKQHKVIDWDQLLRYFDQYWEVLLMHIINFRFIYPSEREHIPRKVLDELLSRLNDQIQLPTPQMKVSRGRLFSRDDYLIDIRKWGYADLIGEPHEPKSS